MNIDLEAASSGEDESAQSAATSEDAPADSSDAGSQYTADQAMDALGTIANVVSDATSGAVTPEFKEFIDSYESFMNDYCDFMEKYTGTETSGDTATLAAMMADYTSLLQQELEWIDKVNAVDQSSLSAADSAYYLAATARVEKRLIEIGQSASWGHARPPAALPAHIGPGPPPRHTASRGLLYNTVQSVPPKLAFTVFDSIIHLD